MEREADCRQAGAVWDRKGWSGLQPWTGAWGAGRSGCRHRRKATAGRGDAVLELLVSVLHDCGKAWTQLGADRVATARNPFHRD